MKIYASDIDGTFITNNDTITDINKDAVNKINKTDNLFVLATGRSVCMSKKIYKQLSNVDYLIASDGNIIVDLKNNNILYEKTISTDSLLKLDKIMKNKNLFTIIFTKDDTYYIDNLDIKHKFFSKIGIKIKSLNDIKKTVHKVSYIIKDNFEINDVKEIIHNTILDSSTRIVTGTSFDSIYFDIIPKNSSKATALEFLSKMLNIEKNNLYVFGDGINDIEMFQFSKNIIAVKNAKEELKEFATSITDDNNNSGVGKWIINNINEN
ncbi:MAG: HAD family hydrolase [Bacilli bacterium]